MSLSAEEQMLLDNYFIFIDEVRKIQFNNIDQNQLLAEKVRILLQQYRNVLVDLSILSAWQVIPQVSNTLQYTQNFSKKQYSHKLHPIILNIQDNLLPSAYFIALSTSRKNNIYSILDNIQALITYIENILYFEEDLFKQSYELAQENNLSYDQAFSSGSLLGLTGQKMPWLMEKKMKQKAIQATLFIPQKPQEKEKDAGERIRSIRFMMKN